MKRTSVLCGLVAATLGIQVASAAVVLQYTFDGAGGVGTASPTTTGTNVTNASNVTIGVTTPLIEISNTYGYTTGYVIRQPTSTGGATGTNNPDNVRTAQTVNQYLEFSLRAADGYQLDLTSLDFLAAKGGASNPRGWGLLTSVGGFDATSTIVGQSDVTTQRTTWSPFSVDLSGASFQGLTNTLTFRIYNYAQGMGQSVEFDNITVNGTVDAVAVPEPAALGVLGLASLGLIRRRRA
jgi:PEP-CTERM motif